ncbi:MAG TPA: MFS transporter [Pseudonocardiaceae bacterium]
MANGTVRGLGAALLAASLLPLNSTMIAVALPDIAREYTHSPGTVTQALVSSYLIAAIVLQSPGGKLGDRLGHWRVVALGQVLIATGAVLGFVAPTLGVLALSRVLMAAGGAVIVPATVALMRIELPPQRRGRAFGTFGAVMSLAAAIGPVIGGELVRAFGWPSIFLANLPVLALSAVLAATARHAPAAVDRAQPSRFDWFGTGLLAAMLTSLVLGLQATGFGSIALIGTCLVLVVPFAWWQRRAADPVVAFSLFRSLPFTAGSLLVALQNLVMYTLLFELPLVLEALLSLDAAATGRLLIFMMLAMVVTSLVAGRLTDWFGSRPVAVAGSLVCLAGLGVLAAGNLSTLGQVRWALVVLGIGIGLVAPAAQNAALSAASRERSGMAAGVSSTMRYLGGITGVAILGRVLDLSGDRDAIISEHHTMLAVFTATLLVGLTCAALLPGRGRRPTPAELPAAGRVPTPNGTNDSA